MTPDPKDAAIEQIILTRMQVATRQELPRYIAAMAEAECFADDITGNLIFQLRSEVLAMRIDRQHATELLTVEFEMPATWWQHLKQQYAARWWLRWLIARRPIQTSTQSRTVHVSFDIERYRTFPDATITFPTNLGQEVRLLIPGRVRRHDS